MSIQHNDQVWGKLNKEKTPMTYPVADEETYGITRLYKELGEHEDGALTQKSASEYLNSKQPKLTSENAGENITITEEEGITKINSTASSSTVDYEKLDNKPQINSVDLIGNISFGQLGITKAIGKYSGEFLNIHSSDDYFPVNYIAQCTDAYSNTFKVGYFYKKTLDNWTHIEVDDIPSVLSQLTNDVGFITNTVSDLVNYYTKSQTYTQSEVNTLIGNLHDLHFEVVQDFPQDPQGNVIYLIPKDDPEQSDTYDEWIYANNQWEQIGNTNIDLSDYATKTFVLDNIPQKPANWFTQEHLTGSNNIYQCVTSGQGFVEGYFYKDDSTLNQWTRIDVQPIQAPPVTSVNSKTGAVVLNASDVGAVDAGRPITMISGYIETGKAIGTVIDYTVKTSSIPWRHAVVSCEEGDIFTLNVIGGGTPRAWCFVDDEDKVISVAAIGASVINSQITAPANSAKLIINDSSNTYTSYSGIPLSSTLETLESDILSKVDTKISNSNITYLRYEKVMKYENNQITFRNASVWYTYIIPVHPTLRDYYKIILETRDAADILYYAFISTPTLENILDWDNIPANEILLRKQNAPTNDIIQDEVQAPQNATYLLLCMAKNVLLPLAIPCVKIKARNAASSIHNMRSWETITKDLDSYTFNDLTNMVNVVSGISLHTDGSIKVNPGQYYLRVLRNKETLNNILLRMRSRAEGSNEVRVVGQYNSAHASSRSIRFGLNDNVDYTVNEWRFPFFADYYDILTLFIFVGADSALYIKDFNVDNSDYRIIPDSGVRLDAHLGYQKIAPENTMSAYISAAKMGYKYCISNIKSTSDGVFVCCHNATINAFATNMDGTELTEDVYISDKTYSELLEYDFGYKLGGEAFKGEHIPKYEDFLQLCSRTGMHPIYSNHGFISNSSLPHQTDLTGTQFQELKAMLNKYRLLDKFSIKVHPDILANVYPLLGDDIEEYIVLINQSDYANLTSILTQISALNIPANKVCVEFSQNNSQDIPSQTAVETVLAEGYRASVYDVYDLRSRDYKRLMSYGITGFTDDGNGCTGLNW